MPLRLIKSLSLSLISGDPSFLLSGVGVHILRLHQRRVSGNVHLETEGNHEIAFFLVMPHNDKNLVRNESTGKA